MDTEEDTEESSTAKPDHGSLGAHRSGPKKGGRMQLVTAPKGRPLTHFLCMVTSMNPALAAKLVEIQQVLIAKFSLPAQLSVNVVDDLHVTWFTLSLNSTEDEIKVLQAVESTKECGPRDGFVVGYDDISNFGKRVLWAKPVFPNSDGLKQIVEWKSRSAMLLPEYVLDISHWTPHGTVMKTSKLKPRDKTIGFTDEMVSEASKLFQECSFEHQFVDKITLMSCRKDSDGRYIRRGSVKFQSS